MLSKPVKPTRSLHTNSRAGSMRSSLFFKPKIEESSDNNSEPRSASNVSIDDEEDQLGFSDLVVGHDVDITRTLNQYAMANDLWHSSTMDWGRRFVCVGYNTLHVVEPLPQDNDEEPDEFAQDLPNCKRLWSWLILCEDKTVITIYEDPYPFRQPGTALSAREQRNLGIIRRNLVNVFRQCSRTRDPLAHVTPLALPLRVRVGDSAKEAVHRASDIPGLLFYYIFDDWLTIYTLIARRDNHYAVELNALRRQMLQKAELHQIDRLHHLGCQLASLKRLYQSYMLLVDRLLGRREITLASLQNSQVVHSGGIAGYHPGLDSGYLGATGIEYSYSQPAAAAPYPLGESHSMLGVALSSAARVRFERLKHRLQLYALNEVAECLVQKESLVMMNFNLLAIKEALSVERLTQVTLLLAKVTLLFMPVSLLTAYFSCQFADFSFSYKAYWKCFAGVFVGSCVFLATFSLISGGTGAGEAALARIVVRPWSRRLVDFCTGGGRGLLSKVKKRRKGGGSGSSRFGGSSGNTRYGGHTSGSGSGGESRIPDLPQRPDRLEIPI